MRPTSGVTFGGRYQLSSRVAVAVVVENGGGLGQSGFGNLVAAPIARSVMEAVLNR